MKLSFGFGTEDDGSLQVLWKDGERVFCRGWHLDSDGNRKAVLAVMPAAEHPTPASLDRLAREYGLKDELDSAWAARPLELVREHGQAMLVIEDTGGEPLDQLLGVPMEMGRFLRLAANIAAAMGQVHQQGLVHKDVKPANILVAGAGGEVRLTGFGIASRLPRERQATEPPESISGTLAYIAPEQTGRMNRSVDSRSDLYALGVTFYQMLTGSLPFIASDPMEWVHCHIARTPVPPAERCKTVPTMVSAIVVKLLAKTAEERYQTATGVEQDLRRCLTQWEAQGQVDAFPLGQYDTPDRLLIPERLYGREREVATLLAAFDRVAKGGAPELVLISGYSGIGKSSIVHELHRVLVPQRGLFAAGKFDQYKRDIPYSTLVQAFQSLIHPLLGESEPRLAGWRDAFREALGPNGQLMIDVVPELRLIIGEQPPIPGLPPQDAQRRFQLVFQRFIGVFARPEHPLALFLDDLQWLDAATLDLVEHLLAQPDVQHLLLIGAYRSNEVDTTHPLRRKLKAIRQAGAIVHDIALAPLRRRDLAQLIADAVCGARERIFPLARLVHDKTAGNPFFAIQFVSALADEGLLTFDRKQARWSWDIERIRARGYTDNVADLMVGKLNRLPVETQGAMQQLACLGNVAATRTLSLVSGTAEAQVHSDLWAAVRAELVKQQEGFYRFIHDRVQEAAYSLIPESLRAEAHLRIGRQLAAHTPPEQREEAIFEIVNQLNRGEPLITSQDEREQLAELNLIAGKRAKAATAYTSALKYLAVGEMLFSDASRDRNYPLFFAVEFHMAECELLTANLAAANGRLSMLARLSRDVHDRAAVARLRLTLYTTLDQSDRCVEVCLEYLQRVGTQWSPHPTREEVRREYDRIWSQLGSRSIEDLIDGPLMNEGDALATLDVLTEAVTPALFTDDNLVSLVICRMVNLSLEHGNSDGSCFAYVWLGMIAGPHFGNYEAGFRFGQLGYDLVEKRGLQRFQARTYMSFGNLVMPWTRHVKTGRDLVRRAFDAANKIGDLTFAAYSCNELNTNLLAAGDSLAEVELEAEHGFAFAKKARFGLVIDIIKAQLGLVRTLRGLTPKFGSFDTEQFNELGFERHLASDSRLALPECWYWIRKLQARFFAGDYAAAIDASSRAQRLLWTSPSFFERAEYHFYTALSHAAFCGSATAGQSQEHAEALATHHKQLQVWAENCPENFENRAALIGAEIARIEGRTLDAMRLYEQAIRSARANGFVHNEALAHELAARFYAGNGFEDIAQLYLRNSRYGYLRWGAIGKVRQLDQVYPQLAEPQAVPLPTSTIGTPVEQLDLATVIKVSQAVSGEIVLEKLIDTLMRTALENAGAGRGLLIFPRGGELRVEAEAETTGGDVVVRLRPEPSTAPMPGAIVNFVARTGAPVIRGDAAAENDFDDAYIRDNKPRSVLCLPLIKQCRIVALLYLENNLAPRVFTPARMAVLKLLASEAAISLENGRLYRDLEEREAKIRRLVEANIIGILITTLDGQIIEANDAFLHIVGYDRVDLAAGHIRWTELTPPEWRSVTRQAVAEIRARGCCDPFEKEYFRKDGSRVPVLIARAAFDEARSEAVAFVLDLTELKRAEANARASERRYRDMEMELAHANRVATIGQLTASIAHEVNQPIAATVTNAQAAMRWMDMEQPDLTEVRQALDRIVMSGRRAGEVISRIRGQIKKAPPHRDMLDINETIGEVIGLARGEITKNGIKVETQFADSLPLLHGDRVQLQQVILNLIINASEAMGTIDGSRELRVRTTKEGTNCLCVAVADTGPGLSPGLLERIFSPFYTTKPSGMGLGLSICRSIVEAHGGRLSVAANNPHGAVFQFTLPSVTASPVLAGHADTPVVG
ncbi:trifunctional serine/threonine-protein kinase/ATP-binding protein/sensor histidine kinase [Rhizobium sp. LjRoot258]|uniref:trifunctional serine/threonine-protein kinase/ATP-binding protein/sensor histidine kinase n=1 Tax=Rhizobium sp. LjRoot258 TaxID=3342299 RepID=UPI003ECEE21A